jgi:hypothetical protein
VANKLLQEPDWIRSARESLIDQKRRGNTENMKDIRSEMKKWESKRKGF